MEPLYTLQQFETQGWVTIATNLIKEDAKKNIGKIIEVLYETKDLSYTNNFYKVTIDSKNEKVEKMNGQIIKVKLKSFTNGKFFAEA